MASADSSLPEPGSLELELVELVVLAPEVELAGLAPEVELVCVEDVESGPLVPVVEPDAGWPPPESPVDEEEGCAAVVPLESCVGLVEVEPEVVLAGCVAPLEPVDEVEPELLVGCVVPLWVELALPLELVPPCADPP